MRPMEITVIAGAALVGGAVAYLVTSNNLRASAAPSMPAEELAICEQEVQNLRAHHDTAAAHLKQVTERRDQIRSAPLPGGE